MNKNKTLKKGNCYYVYLNIPDDFIYEIDSIIVEYNEDTGTVNILGEEIPESIKTNMCKYYKDSLKNYILYLEKNLETFLSGNLPAESQIEDSAKIVENSPVLQTYGAMENDKVDVFKKEDIDRNISQTYTSNDVKKLSSEFIFPVNDNIKVNLEIKCKKKGIMFLSCLKPEIQVSCRKCKRCLTLSSSTLCRCGVYLSIEFIPTISRGSFGFVQLDNCEFICINPSTYQLSCEHCDSMYEISNIGIKQKYSFSCWTCYNEIYLEIQVISFIKSKAPQIKQGYELPDKGTCKHYKKSFRWFRFHCCNSLYPCDICHDVETGHEHLLANKMVCGFCSKEQSVKSECNCGMSLKRTTKHWEGGNGTRNKNIMSKKDRKKYTK